MGLLGPLARAVSHGLEGLRNDTRRTAGKPSKVEFWPHRDVVPTRLRPARNEFLLDEIDAFPSAMRNLLVRDTGQSLVEDAEIAAVHDVITAADDRTPESPLGSAWDARRSWVPSVSDLQEAMSDPRPAAFTLHLGADDLLKRADGWITNDNRRFGRHLKQSLGEHLGDPNASPAEISSRLQRFAGQLKSAIGRAQPLVNVDREVLSLVHDRHEVHTTLVIGRIPVASNSPAAEHAREVLATSSADFGDAKDLFTDEAGQSVSIFGILTEPYEPVVFSSLMKPMVDEWAEVKQSDDARQTFWTWRRSRPLAEFVPAAPAVRRAMLRGWFTALVLGQIQGLTEQKVPICVWSPSATGGQGEWLRFPYPLLRPSRQCRRGARGPAGVPSPRAPRDILRPQPSPPQGVPPSA